jgi:hypothetical protein
MKQGDWHEHVFIWRRNGHSVCGCPRSGSHYQLYSVCFMRHSRNLDSKVDGSSHMSLYTLSEEEVEQRNRTDEIWFAYILRSDYGIHASRLIDELRSIIASHGTVPICRDAAALKAWQDEDKRMRDAAVARWAVHFDEIAPEKSKKKGKNSLK